MTVIFEELLRLRGPVQFIELLIGRKWPIDHTLAH